MNRHRRLAVGRRGKYLALSRRYRRVLLDQARHHPAKGLDAQAQRRHVQKQHVLDVPLENPRLNRRPHGHHLVRIDRTVRRLSEQLLDPLLHRRHAGHPSDQNHFADLVGPQARIL